MFEEARIQCPYCFEEIEVVVEPLPEVRQKLVYDCTVCCRPIELVALYHSEGELEIEAHRDTD